MINLLHLNKLIQLIFIFFILIISPAFAATAVDIWEKKENENESGSQTNIKNDKKIKSPILLDDPNKIIVQINEDKIEDNNKSIIGIFDPEENNFNLDMWLATDGEDIKKVLNRIGKLKLSKPSEDLLFQVLFTNSYSPQKNLKADEFLRIKINWLIKKKRIKDLETLLKKNPEVGKNPKAIKYLIDEYLSSADIKSACDKVNFIDRKVKNEYLEKFYIYCLINNDQKEEAQLNLDLLKERGFKDIFFEDKINFLLGLTEKTNQKILDNNLLNFYLSYITSEDFKYQPKEKTDKNIWRYLSSANLIQVNEFENEDVILTYEQAAAQNSFGKEEIFKIYLKVNYNFNQLMNVDEIYKTLPSYKARALIYQSLLLSNDIEKKIYFAFLLKDLFIKDKIFNIYAEELSRILKSIDVEKIPKDYLELVNENIDRNSINKIKFDNDILHRSKVIKHFLDNNGRSGRTEKDFKSIYKKMKKNKNYFISIKDIIVIESLIADGVTLPADLKYTALSAELTVPKNLEELANKKQIGLLMLKIVEIIGEDNIRDLDPETVYFLNRILNELNLKKIRNSILSEALPIRT
jgi:hypothetical protein